MSVETTTHGGLALSKAVQELYAAGQTDYSFEPVILYDPIGNPIGRIKDGDSVIFCLRRGEREIQLTEAFVDPEVNIQSKVKFNHLPFIILTLYHEKFKDLPIAFAPRKINQTLAEVISRAGLTQLHISESEKFAHVTFFLNGGNNLPFRNETDLCIPSLKGIPVEQVPQLSLGKVCEAVQNGIEQGYDFIVTNFANGDVIGHTTNRKAKIECAEVIDAQLSMVIEAALKAGYAVLVTADHGNLEEMTTPAGSPNVSHSTNDVPFVLIAPKIESAYQLHMGNLADIAPTILSILGIPKPAEMTGSSLIASNQNLNCKKLLLIILDGWGIGKDDESNPIYLASTPYWDKLIASYPSTQLMASGDAVGLKVGKNGNSEAGHMNIGAGRVILQDDVRLDKAIHDGTFGRNEIFLQAISDVKSRHTNLHLICLLSEKSSHGSIDYPLALLRMSKEHDLNDIYVHVIFDGRSTEPGSAPALLHKFEQMMSEIGIGKIVTGMGRGIALDRDGDYKKTQYAYEALVFGTGKRYFASSG